MFQCEVIGNIGNDAEIKDFSGKKYVSFNVAHSERKKDAQGVVTESTSWNTPRWSSVGKAKTERLPKKNWLHLQA